MKRIPKGVYPVMITPYTDRNTIDWNAVDNIVEFYAKCGCQGIFAVCLSSEMFHLSEDERAELAARVVRQSAGRMCVVASGHVSNDISEQIRELKRMAESGADAVVMIANRLARTEQDDSVAIANMHTILDAIHDVTFGKYGCPHPYKRMLTDRLLEAMKASGRFAFIKDTCCDAELIAHRVKLLDGKVQLFNANAATILETLESGADGFSGIMANYHPDLYVWLCDNYLKKPEKAKKLAAALSILSAAEGYGHPIAAKYHMSRVGVPMELISRSALPNNFTPLRRHAVDDVITAEEMLREWLAREER